tara:strand:+ start:1311 stop:1580 length:270 start_codon:yes stop_codon:yes gene_type:complete
MSQFYATIQGTRGEATRQGHKNTGITGHIRGWHAGVRVNGFHDPETGTDRFRIYATTGSNGHGHERLIAFVTDTPEGPKVEHLQETNTP